jgi:hypothetical protein
MFLFLTDETNTRPSLDVRFFIYGGILFRVEQLSEIDEKLRTIRNNAGFRPGDEFKFNTATRPRYVSADQHAQAKDAVIRTCTELGCKFIVHIIHHGIIKNQDLDQQVEWAANLVIGRFHTFLREIADDGMCIVDNLPTKKQFRYLSDKFCHGLILPTGREVPLPRIKLYASTCINASHANSAMDIILGTFRYCINNPSNIQAAKKMMAGVIELMWHRKQDDVYHVIERGLIVKPSFPKLRSDYPTFLSDYDDLFSRINSLLSVSGQ